MENEMVERVARALCRQDEQDGAGPWDYHTPKYQDRYRECARAAIEAMGEHTEAMLDAGTAALWPPNEYLPGSAAVAAYRAMIAAALAG